MDTLPERGQHPIDEWPTSSMNADLLSIEIPQQLHSSFEIWGRSPRLEQEADGHILRGLE